MTDLSITKFCPKCDNHLPISDFNFKNKAKGIYQHSCRECTKAYIRDHYSRNKGQYLERNRRARKRSRQRLTDLKTAPCTDCGQTFPTFVMEFDHRDPATKEFSISRGPFTWYRRVEEEVKKCDLVCANCHKIRTHTRRWGSQGLEP